MQVKRYSNIIGIDDAPFTQEQVDKVKIVGAVFAGLRLDGVVIGEIDKDGVDAAETIATMLANSKFFEHAQLLMLQGITLAGFNVVDVFYLHERLKLPVLVVTRKAADMESVRKALLTKIPGGNKKWLLIERLGPMEPVGPIFVQRVGLTLEEAAYIVEHFSIHSQIPEPIRTAHLIAGAIASGVSRGSP